MNDVFLSYCWMRYVLAPFPSKMRGENNEWCTTVDTVQCLSIAFRDCTRVLGSFFSGSL